MKKRAFTHQPTALLPAVGFDEALLLAPDAAIARYFARVTLASPSLERVALDDALGRVLAQAIDADGDYPNAPRSAMDGFALTAGSTPGRLRIAGEIRMGGSWGGDAVEPDEALRVPTGGLVPPGCDAVIAIEDACVRGDHIVVEAPVPFGDCVTPQGCDMRAGERVFGLGRWVRASDLAVLATLGVVDVPVYRRPIIAVLSSGDELVAPNLRPAPGKIRDSNRYAVAGSLRAMGAQPMHVPTVVDRPGALEAALRTALEVCDAAVITGGSSVGERDLTPGEIGALGAPGVIVHGLRIKPGKPTVLAAVGGKPVIGLPGNPSSALIVLQAVAAPIVAALVGAALPGRSARARLAAPLHSRAGWTWYLPVAVENEGDAAMAHPLALRSSAVSLTARASGYVIMDEHDTDLAAGTSVVVHRFH